MIVSSFATSPASTSPALARKSEACTTLPESADGPRTVAVCPSIEMFAPMRIISLACKNRFSKIFSEISDVPSACVAKAMNCACMSVANPGYSSVVTSALTNFFAPRTRIVLLFTISTGTPACSNFAITAPKCSGAQCVIVSSPPVIAPATRNLRPHLPQHLHQIRHFRFTRRILQHRLPIRQRRRHQNIFRPRHRNFLKHDMRALQPSALRRPCLDVSVRRANLRPHLLQRLQVQIHRPRPNRTASRQRNSRHSHARHQRPQRQHRRPHRLHQLIRRLRVVQLRRLDHVVAARYFRHRNSRVHEGQQLAHRNQVAHFRNVVQRHLLCRKQSRRHHRQRRILRPADRHRPPQRFPAPDPKFIHPVVRLFLVEATLRRNLPSLLVALASSRRFGVRQLAAAFLPCALCVSSWCSLCLAYAATLSGRRHPSFRDFSLRPSAFSASLRYPFLSVLNNRDYSPSAFRKSPLLSFNLFFASRAPTPRFNITNATLKSCPAARRACSAADTLFLLASARIRSARSASFSFVSIMSIIKFSYTCPSRAITAVLSMLSAIFCDVPAFSRVDPVNTSGPTSGAITIFASRPTGIRKFDVTATVVAPRFRAYFSAPTTYGVVPLAAIPTTTSRRVNFFARKSRSPLPSESSAPSTALVIARLPPAINATTSFGEVPNVGGHSAASSTPIRPLDPAPT